VGMDVPTCEALIDRYCSAWCEPDPARCDAILASVWEEGATYTDPTVHCAGRASLLEHIGRVQARRSGVRVLRTTPIDLHHGLVRFGWHAVDPAGKRFVAGVDFVELSANDKLARVVGFFDGASAAGSSPVSP